MSAKIIGTIFIIILWVYIIYSLIKLWVVMVNFIFSPRGEQWQKIKKWAQQEYEYDWYSVNGVGTRLYGQEEGAIVGDDFSFVTTSYSCFIFIPLVPLYEHRVIPRGEHKTFLGRKENYTVLNTFEIDRKKYPIFKMFITPLALIFCTALIVFGLYFSAISFYNWIV